MFLKRLLKKTPKYWSLNVLNLPSFSPGTIVLPLI